MSNIDKQALREAAEKATKGQWAVEFDDEIYSTDGVNYEQIAMVFSENEARDAAFIAAANPATVLALLDELEPMALAHLNLNLLCDVYRTAYEEARHDGLVNWEAAASLTEENRDLKRKLEAAEKRIAELEARDKPKFVQCWSCKHDIEVLAIADCDGYCPRCAAPIDLDDEPYAAAGKGE